MKSGHKINSAEGWQIFVSNFHSVSHGVIRIGADSGGYLGWQVTFISGSKFLSFIGSPAIYGFRNECHVPRTVATKLPPLSQNPGSAPARVLLLYEIILPALITVDVLSSFAGLLLYKNLLPFTRQRLWMTESPTLRSVQKLDVSNWPLPSLVGKKKLRLTLKNS